VGEHGTYFQLFAKDGSKALYQGTATSYALPAAPPTDTTFLLVVTMSPGITGGGFTPVAVTRYATLAITISGPDLKPNSVVSTADVSVGNALTVTGTASVPGQSSFGAVAIGGTLDVSGATTLTGPLTAAGATTLSGATVNNALTATGILAVTGQSTLERRRRTGGARHGVDVRIGERTSTRNVPGAHRRCRYRDCLLTIRKPLRLHCRDLQRGHRPSLRPAGRSGIAHAAHPGRRELHSQLLADRRGLVFPWLWYGPAERDGAQRAVLVDTDRRRAAAFSRQSVVDAPQISVTSPTVKLTWRPARKKKTASASRSRPAAKARPRAGSAKAAALRSIPRTACRPIRSPSTAASRPHVQCRAWHAVDLLFGLQVESQ
jgi:hypothetical protein